MDVKAFVDALLGGLSQSEAFGQVAWQVEGPIVKGRSIVDADTFLRFYFNETTGTLAFALIRRQVRIWGVDHDKLRGWHLHPAADPSGHVAISPLSVDEMIHALREVIAASPGHGQS